MPVPPVVASFETVSATSQLSVVPPESFICWRAACSKKKMDQKIIWLKFLELRELMLLETWFRDEEEASRNTLAWPRVNGLLGYHNKVLLRLASGTPDKGHWSKLNPNSARYASLPFMQQVITTNNIPLSYTCKAQPCSCTWFQNMLWVIRVQKSLH